MAVLRLFGHPALERKGTREALSLPPKAVALVAIVAANAAGPLSRDWLAQCLWPDADPAQGLANLRRQLHLAARALGQDAFTITRQTIQWNQRSGMDVDVVQFDARAKSEPDAAVQYYAGELCAGIDEAALDELRLRYRSEYERALHELIARDKRSGRHDSLRTWLQLLITYDPFDEGAVRELMQLRKQSGDRAGAIRDYNALSQRLRAELGVEPQRETVALFSQIIGEDAVPTTPHNVVNPTTTFVGRQLELRAIQSGLRQTRVVVLVGPGGIGKSRLATRSCFDLLLSYPHGVWFVDLEHASSEADIWLGIAQAARINAGGSPEAAVLQHFSKAQALIALDTCEHVVDDAKSAIEKLTLRTDVHVLATSRRRIAVPQAYEIDVGPLDIPPAALADGDSPLRYSAYRLFLERAAHVSPSFRVEERNVAAVTALLASIDGLPLAIELVASRANALSIGGMRKRLGEALRTAREHAGARNRTLDAALAWSYGLLAADQRELFAALGIFNGTFTADDVEHVCRHIADPVSRLFELIDASLVSVVSTDDEPRYRLLETTRGFALEKLRPVLSYMEKSHAEHFSNKADAFAAMAETEFADSLNALVNAMPDFLAALETAARYGWGSVGRRLIEGLYRFAMRGHFTVPVRERAKALLENTNIPMADRAGVARLAAILEENAPSLPLYEFAASYYRESGDEVRLCDTLSGLAATHFRMGEYEKSERLLRYVRDKMEHGGDRRVSLKALGRLGTLYTTHTGEGRYDQALEIIPRLASELQALGEVRQAAQHLKNLAAGAYFVQRYDDALTWAQQALELTALTSEVAMRLNLLTLCGAAEQERGNLEIAADWHLQACDLLASLGDGPEVADSIADIAGTLAALGDCASAARLAGYAERLREKLAFPIHPAERSGYDRMLARLEAGLGAHLDAAWAGVPGETLEELGAMARRALSRARCLPARASAKESEDTTSLS
jgi:predicted ATPase/DNA-binding SARP family transcriptional activator